VKKTLLNISTTFVVVITCMLLGACTQSNKATVYVGRGGSGGVAGISSGTNYGGHPCVKGRGVSVAELQQQLAGEYSVASSDRWAGQAFYQEVGAGNGSPRTITFVMAAGRQVFIDNGSGTPSYLYDCCNRIWPVPAGVTQSESGGASVVINQTNTQAPTFLNSFGEGLGGGLGVTLGVGMTEVSNNARRWNSGYYYPLRREYRPSRYCPPVQRKYYQPRQQQRYCPPVQQQRYCPPPREQYRPPVRQPYCPPASASQSVGRGGSSKVFQGAHNRTRDPNGDR